MSTTMTNVKERPILFSGEMVRAILDGRKTQTRRKMKPQPAPLTSDAATLGIPATEGDWAFSYGNGPSFRVSSKRNGPDNWAVDCPCPYGLPGDRLWVREAWQITGRLGTEYAVWYPAGGEAVGIDVGFEGPSPKWDAMIHDDRVRPSIHMPRWACRLTLEITDVRVERLHEISEADAIAEGVLAWRESWTTTQAATAALFASVSRLATKSDSVPVWLFHQLWESINGHESLLANPWVWVISFKPLTSR
jgi:hypothetical protein